MGTQTGKQIADAMVNYYLIKEYKYVNSRQSEGTIFIQPSLLSSLSDEYLGSVTFKAGSTAVKLKTENLYSYFNIMFPIVQLTISNLIADLANGLQFWRVAIHREPKHHRPNGHETELILSATLSNKADMRRAIIEYRELCACIHANLMVIKKIGAIKPLQGLIDIHLMTQNRWHIIRDTAVIDDSYDNEDDMVGKSFATGILSRGHNGKHFHTVVIPRGKLLTLYAHALAHNEELVRLRTVCGPYPKGIDGLVYGMSLPSLKPDSGEWHGN